MTRDAILDKGERVFVLTVAMVLGAETLFTVMLGGQHFAWPRVLLGVFSSVFILFLAQRLYSGDRGIVNLAIGWAGFHLVLLAFSLAIGPQSQDGALGFLQSLGTPVRYMALLKLIAYSSFVGVLLTPCCAQAFLADRRGDDVQKFLPPDVADEGGTIAWTPDQIQYFSGLSAWMLGAAAVLLIGGLVIVVNAVPRSLQISYLQTLSILEGLLLVALGGLLASPALAVGNIGTPGGNSQGDLKAAVQRLGKWHVAAAAVGAALALVIVLRFLEIWTHS